MTKVRRTKAEKRLRRELGVAWFLSAAADTASYAPKLVFGTPRGYEPDDPKHQEYYSETRTSPLQGGVPEFTVNVYHRENDDVGRVFKVTVQEVTA